MITRNMYDVIVQYYKDGEFHEFNHHTVFTTKSITDETAILACKTVISDLWFGRRSLGKWNFLTGANFTGAYITKRDYGADE